MVLLCCPFISQFDIKNILQIKLCKSLFQFLEFIKIGVVFIQKITIHKAHVAMLRSRLFNRATFEVRRQFLISSKKIFKDGNKHVCYLSRVSFTIKDVVLKCFTRGIINVKNIDCIRRIRRWGWFYDSPITVISVSQEFVKD